jgi:hypothetical protein
MRSVVLLLVAVACGDNTTPAEVDAPEAPSPLAYRLNVHSGEPLDRPPAAVRPTIFIDDVATDALEREYIDLDTAAADVHRIELRHGTVVIARLEIQPSTTACAMIHPLKRYRQSVCFLESGTLGTSSETLEGSDGSCIGDAFGCPGVCVGGCPAGERCTSRIVLRDPLSSHLGCAPIGRKREGQRCTLIADLAGDYDNCGESLLCIAGTCRATCTPQITQCPIGTCNYLPGHSFALGICG